MRRPILTILAALLALAGPAPSLSTAASPPAEIGPGAPIQTANDAEKASNRLSAYFDGAPLADELSARPAAAGTDPLGELLEGRRPALVVSPPAVPVPTVPKAASPSDSLVLVQIDGLSYDHLQEAIAKGHAPNLKALLDGERYRAAPYLGGLPTVTMAAQTAIFYGKLIPGNEWYDKALDKEIFASDHEKEFPSETGLLHGGQVYLSELSGGAVEGADVNRIFSEDVEKMGTLRAVLKELYWGGPLFLRYLFAHNPLVSIPSFLYNVVRDAWKMRGDFKERGFTSEKDGKAPYFISLIGNLWTPIAVEGIKRAIRNKVPVAYTDLSNYDEWAHYYGASSQEAFEILEKIDSHIGEIAETAREHGGRLVIFSDHGQTPTDNFIKKFGLTPQEMVDGLVRETSPEAADGEVIFWHVYSMGNLYVRGTPGHLDEEAIELRYPGLVEKLARHPGIGLVAVRRGESGFALVGKQGTDLHGPDGRLLSGGGLLETYADSKASGRMLAVQIKNYLDIEQSGDLVIFSPYEEGRTVDYNYKYTIISAHGGMGGEQMHPFLLYDPADVPQLKPEEMVDARGLHEALRTQR